MHLSTRKSMLLVGVLATSAALVLAQSNNAPPHVDSRGSLRDSARRRILSEVEPTEDCTLTMPRPTPKGMIPVFVPAFPGSGSSLARTLIPLLTGFDMGTPRSRPDGNFDVVALKTHHPHGMPLPSWESEIHRAVILIRNPMFSIPSFCNYVYESKNGLKTHSVKAPMEYWMEWREVQFPRALNIWVNSVEFWMEKESIKDRFILSYEDVTSEENGARTAQRLAEFFVDTGVKPVDADTIPCIWAKALYGKDGLKRIRQQGGTKRKGANRKQPFATRHLESMIAAIDMLTQKYAYNKDLRRVLKNYRDAMVAETELIQEEQVAQG